METLVLILFPFLSGLLILFLKHPVWVKRVATGLSLVQLAYTCWILSIFDPVSGYQFVFRQAWLPHLGIDLHFGLDGISLLMVLLTNLLLPFIILSGFSSEKKREPLLHFLIFFAQAALLGVFTSFNAIVFYIFWELALIPVFFILFLWGGERRQPVTLKFFIYTLFGSIFMLFVFIYLYQKTPYPHSFDYFAFLKLPLDDPREAYLFFFLALAFFIKIPLFPGHSWQPETYNTAPYQGTMILAGLLMKMGVYGMIRWLMPVMPFYVSAYSWFMIFLPIAGIIYASVIALKQPNLKILIAFSSMAHAGLMGASLFGLNLFTLQGVLFQSFSHGLIIVSLFYFVQLIEERTETTKLPRLGGIKTVAPRFAGLMLISVLASIGLPLTNCFVGEFLMIMGLYAAQPVYALLGGTTIVLGAVYMLYAYQQAVLGEANPLTAGFSDLNQRELTVILPLILLILLFGVYPQPLLQLTEFSAQELLNLPFSSK